MEKFRNSAPKEGETPRLSKYKQRMLDQKKGQTKVIDENRRILIQFSDPDGNSVEQKYDLALGTTQEDLQVLMNQILENKSSEEYTFYHKHVEIRKSLGEFAVELGELDPEKVLEVTYHPQEMFHVRPITRISSSLAGHKEAILDVAFSPNGKYLVSASGDKTVRFWDVNIEAPLATVTGHLNAVLVIAWSPNGEFLASGDESGLIIVWEGETHKKISELDGHKKWINGISWEPLHKNPGSTRLASCSKDMSTKVWNVPLGRCECTTSMHSASVTKILWGGQDLIFSTSQDRTVKVWSPDGRIIKELRTGCFDHKMEQYTDKDTMQKVALEKYNKLKGDKDERIVTGSDDCSLYMWCPKVSAQPTKRLLGHQLPVNHCQFSPNSQYIVSASYDKSIRLWNGYSGDSLSVCRGHISAVYLISWSLDSRMLVSASKDSTMKIWDAKTRKLMFDLPGHADEVYAIDWSPDGEKVASGSKDRMLRIWKN